MNFFLSDFFAIFISSFGNFLLHKVTVLFKKKIFQRVKRKKSVEIHQGQLNRTNGKANVKVMVLP